MRLLVLSRRDSSFLHSVRYLRRTAVNQDDIDNLAAKKPEDNKPAVELVEELDLADKLTISVLNR
jgi:hypothetical protein